MGFEKMLKKMSGKEDISSLRGTIPEFLDKVLLSIEMEEDKETMSDSKKMMKKMKIIKSLFKSVMDDNYKKDEILMSQWNTFVNEILKRLESGKLEKESIKAFEYLWKMSMDKNEAMLWGNKEDFFTGNMTQDISKEEMKNNTMVKVSMLLEKMTGMFKKMVLKLSGKEDIANMKGNVPDVLDRIMVMMEMEEGGEQIMAIMDKESTDGMCCRFKRISGTMDDKLDGVYRLITERARNLPSICMNSCMYEKMGSRGRKFCFAYSTLSRAQCMNGGEELPGQESWTRPDDWTKRPDGWTNKPDGWSRPDGMTNPDGWSRPDGMTKLDGWSGPNGMTKPEWTEKPGKPDGMTKPDGWSRPDGMTKPEWTKKPGDGNGRPTKSQ